MSWKKAFLILCILSVLLIMLMVSGCTGSQSVTTTPTPAATPTPMPSTMPTPTPTPTTAPTTVPTPVYTPTPLPETIHVPAPDSYWPDYDFHWSFPDKGPLMLIVNGNVTPALYLHLDDLKAYPQHYAIMSFSNDSGEIIYVSGIGPYLSDILNSTTITGNANAIDIFYNGTSRRVPIPDDMDSEYDVILAINSDNTLEFIDHGVEADIDMRLNNVEKLTIIRYLK